MAGQHEEHDDACDGNAAARACYGSIPENGGVNDGNVAERELLVVDDDETRSPAPDPKAPLAARLLDDGELLRDEMSGMANLAVPVTLTYLLEMLPGLITIVLVGRIDGEEGYSEGEDGAGPVSVRKLHLDGASMAIAFANVVALSPAYGLLTAMDTLCSQAHGASQPHRLGTYSLTALAVISAVFLLSSIAIWNASSILTALGQPLEVSRLAGEFVRWYLPGIPAIYLYEILRKVFQSSNDAAPMVVAALAANLVNVFLGYHLVHRTEWGWMGAAVARTIGNFVMVPALLLGNAMSLKRYRRAKEGKPPHRDDEWGVQQYLEVGSGSNGTADGRDAKQDYGKDDDRPFDPSVLWEGFVMSEALSIAMIVEFLSLGVPGMLQLMFEWCAFEAIALLCGLLPGREAIVGIGANSIIMNVASMTYMLYLGASVAGNVRVGNALGAGDAHRAEIASNLTLVLGAAMGVANVAFLLACREVIPWFFTTDFDIAEKAAHLFLIATAFQLPDAVNGCVQGIFRGSGRQALAAACNFVAYYVIGIPTGYVLGVRMERGVEGLWWGMTAGLCAISVGCSIIVLRSNWVKLSSDATSRLNR